MNPKKKVFATIITLDYIHYALTLNKSLLIYDPNIHLRVLISDSEADLSDISDNFSNIEFYYADQLCQKGIARDIYDKYAISDMDYFRWSVKPVFINFLLNQKYDQVFFVDSDIYFFASYDFLSDDLEANGVLLTPHWRASNPNKDEKNFSILQTSGLFNAGFVGVSKDGMQAMEWWASACLYKCKKEPNKGFFVDQAYLDLLPVYFENIKVERHRGCNVANWNQVECERILTENGKVKIKGDFEIVFIHFTKSTIEGIKYGQDYLLRPYLDKYQKSLAMYKYWVRHSTNIFFKTLNLSRKQITKPKTSLQNNSIKDDLFLNPTFSIRTLDLSVVRHSILNALKTRLGDFHGRLLDVGCGQMPYKPLLKSSSSRVMQYIGLDLEDNPIHNNDPDITWQAGKIPLADGSIDCAIATEVFEHCPDPVTVMSEICRVLKPGGLLFYTVPFIWPLHEVPHDAYRYTPFALNRLLAASGFVNIEQSPLGGWDASLAQMLGLWVRRRAMGKWKRTILAILFMPLIFLLYQKDKRAITQFKESTMITGLYGTARKLETETVSGS